MDDLIDRLAVLSPPASRVPDLAFVRKRATRRRRRRTTTVGIAAAGVLLVVGVGASQLLADRGPATRRVAAGPSGEDVSSWGGPVDLDVGDGVLYVTFGWQLDLGQAGGVARLDPTTGEVDPITSLPASSRVAYADGSLWVATGRTGGRDDLARIDASTGEVQGRVELPGAGGWWIVGADDAVWLMSMERIVRVEADAMTAELLDEPSVGPQFTEPVVVDGDLWMGGDDGLVRVRPDGSAAHFDGPETGNRIYGLAFDGTRLWVASSAGADVPSVVGWIDPATTDLGGPVAHPSTMPGTVTEIGVLDDEICIGLNSFAGQFAKCGELTPDAPLVLDRWPVEDALDLDGGGWVVLDGAAWGTIWSDGIVRRVDAATLRGRDVVELPFDGDALHDEQNRPIGPEVEVASGDLPSGLGRWRLGAYETSVYICTRLHTRVGAWGGCDSKTDDPLVVSMSSSDGSGSDGLPAQAIATVRPDVAEVRLELDSGEVIEMEPIDVGYPVNFAYAYLPEGTQVRRTVAVDADGNILDAYPGLLTTG